MASLEKSTYPLPHPKSSLCMGEGMQEKRLQWGQWKEEFRETKQVRDILGLFAAKSSSSAQDSFFLPISLLINLKNV